MTKLFKWWRFSYDSCVIVWTYKLCGRNINKVDMLTINITGIIDLFLHDKINIIIIIINISGVSRIADRITLSSRLFYGCFTVITVFYDNNSKCLQNLPFGRFLECTPVSYALYYCAWPMTLLCIIISGTLTLQYST